MEVNGLSYWEELLLEKKVFILAGPGCYQKAFRHPKDPGNSRSAIFYTNQC